MKTIGERINEIKIFYFGKKRGSNKAFADTVGVAANVVSNWFNREDRIGKEVIEKVLNAFPDVDKGWLIGGNGNMLKSGTTTKQEQGEGVPYFDLDFLEEFDTVFNNKSIKPEYFINFKPYNKASCWCNVSGHSMEPEINHGDTIALKKINDLSFIPFGEVYAIITKNDIRTIKRIGPSEKENCVRLFPANKGDGYGVQDIRIDMIDKLFQVLGCVKRF